MRAAEILAEMLLSEAAIYGLVYGPNIPKAGYWVSGDTFDKLVAKAGQGLGIRGQAGNTKQIANTLIARGYSLVSRVAGDILLVGKEVPELSERAVEMLNVQATSKVVHYPQSLDVPVDTNGKDAFGISMSPEEQQKLKQQRAAEKQARTTMTPDEQEEFRKWRMSAGKSGRALATSRAPRPAASPAAPPPATP